MGRPREHGEETREQLLEAAARLYAEEGPDALSVRRLADEVGTTTRAIYSVFGSKEGLLSAMYRQGADVFVRTAFAVPASDDPVDELLPLAMSYREAALEHRNLYGLLFERRVAGFTPTDEDQEYLRRGLYRVFDTVRRGVEHGVLPDRDPMELTDELWAVVHGLASLELQGCLGDPDHAASAWRNLVGTMLAGLTRTPTTAGRN